MRFTSVLRAPPKWWTLRNPTPSPTYEQVKPKNPFPIDEYRKKIYWDGQGWRKGDWKGYTLWVLIILFGSALTPLKNLNEWFFRLRYEWTVNGWQKKGGGDEGDHDHH